MRLVGLTATGLCVLGLFLANAATVQAQPLYGYYFNGWYYADSPAYITSPNSTRSYYLAPGAPAQGSTPTRSYYYAPRAPVDDPPPFTGNAPVAPLSEMGNGNFPSISP